MNLGVGQAFEGQPDLLRMIEIAQKAQQGDLVKALHKQYRMLLCTPAPSPIIFLASLISFCLPFSNFFIFLFYYPSFSIFIICHLPVILIPCLVC